MLSSREKALVVVAYYKGTADNDVLKGTDSKHAYGISIECTEKILSELGLEITFEEDFEDFMRELDVITNILSKEYEEDRRFTGTPRNPVYCKICQVEYIDFCMKHCGIPDSWEVRRKG